MRHYVLMGVSGCGKSTVGEALAAACGIDFVDGDDLHPESNIRKMASGTPLNDDDRAPWLAKVGQRLASNDGPVAIGCSALKRRYRDWIRSEVGAPVGFLHLAAPKAVLAKRVAERTHHFMPAGLLDSQYDALEQLEPSEQGRVIDISRSFAEVVAQAERYVRETLT